MKQLKVCFIGIGSIAKRHITNLVKIAQEDDIQLTIDAVSRSGKRETESVFCIIRKVFSDIKEVSEVYDVIFITNPTECHIDTLRNTSSFGKNFFIEKPIATPYQIDKLDCFNKMQDAVYYVACPLRYNSVIQYVKNKIQKEEVISVRCISSSYLPDWRPGIDYRSTYSAQKHLGGGVSIDLIHEWDYITDIFGFPNQVHYMGGKVSNLEIDSDDYAIYIAKYENRIVEVHLDYFGRKTIRTMTLFTKDDTIVADIINSKITFLKDNKTIEFNEERDGYQIKELRHFLDMIDGKVPQDSDINHGIKVLRLTQGEL